ncbi:transporter substrate-binding domain-containing protein [Enterobacter cloacae]|uniref:transporter substrate-binding domain-containing protein n=1 Tax=Enterobacter cloacae TaxID=550 RepID=UPI0021D1A684|nr:transporter substrate-binding domain-containing protein [Enterobacter cloacae]MCU6208161.1 transporter substrate-binding domain-containing protein [Enterobacter cloacae]
MLWMITTVDHAKEPAAQQLRLFSRERPTLLSFNLDDTHWRWLGLKRELKVATWAPDNPPFDIVPDTGIYEGIYADYIRLIGSNLGLTTRLLRYPSREKALEALRHKEVDTLVDDGGGQPVRQLGLLESRSFMANLPVLVSSESTASHTVKADMPMRLAVTEGYLSDQQISARFPAASIVRFPSSEAGLACVVHSKCDFFFGNITTTSFLIQRNYGNALTLSDVFSAEGAGSRFILRNEDTELQQAINAVLDAIPETLHKNISRQWVQRPDIWRFQKPLDLTDQEKRWIEHNPTVRVLVNAFYTPFSMLDDDGTFHGISADLLRLIHLRTGIRFVPVRVNSALEVFDRLENREGDMVATVIYDPSRENIALFSRPWLYTAGVLVVKNQPDAPVSLSNNMTLAVVGDRSLALVEQLSKEWPGIKWIYTENCGSALELVNMGKADGALHNQLGASFMIDRYFRDKLKIVAQLGEKPNQLGFAVRRDEPELQDILNKALADIQPQEISLIVHKWQNAPDFTVNTWRLYNREFYWVLAGAGTIILLILMWVYTRNKEIKRRQLAEEELRAQLAFRDTLINGSPTPVYVLNRQMLVVTSNEAYEQYFVDVPAENLRYSLFDLRHPLAGLREYLTEVLVHNEEILSHGQTREFSVNNGSDERIIDHWSTPFVDSKGKNAGLICGWQDITDHKQLLTALSEEKEHAEQANKAKSAFLATMSHEIRTPISAIIGLLELESKIQPDNEAIKVSYTSAQTLLSLIGDVLDMARIESGEFELVPEWLPLDSLVPPVIKIFEEMARQKGIELRYINQIESDLEIKVDSSRLRQVIANYISNAVKFTKQGHVVLQIHSQKIGDEALTLHIEIEDTGSGISLSDQKKLFRPFAQLNEGRSQTGTGLGLVISSQLLEKMNGYMQMRSSPGRGTQILIEITLPVRQQRQQVISGNELLSDPQKKLSILIVDDHPVNRMVLHSQLSLLGHTVTEAESGHDALTYWQNNQFDALITDCTMPGMDGFILTQKIREVGDPLPIFGLTANAQPKIRAQAMAAGMNDCLFKPLRLAILKSVLLKVRKLDLVPTLDEMIHLNDLKEMLHNDEAMIGRLLSRIGRENEMDIVECRACFARGENKELASCLHRIGGAAQVICAMEIDDLASKLEKLALEAGSEDEIAKGLDTLESKLKALQLSINQYLNLINDSL